MLPEVDDALASLLKAEALNSTVLDGAPVDVVFDPPTSGWASRQNGPVVNAFLYDVREDVDRRQPYTVTERGQDGRVERRRPGTRYYRLSYLLTAWTTRPTDEHRLLGLMLEALIGFDRIPSAHVSDRFDGAQLLLTTALPPGADRSLTDLWSALGGEMKPSLDLVVVAPLTPRQPEPPIEVGRPVRERRVEVARKG